MISLQFAGALNPKRKGIQRLLRIRAQLSIIACILVLPHVVLYLINIISSLHFILNMRGKVLALYAGYLLAGVVAFVVMLPLFITSFKKIRQKMRAISWKKLQKWAYLFYVLIFAHAICVVLLSSDINWLRLGLYTALLAAYLICK